MGRIRMRFRIQVMRIKNKQGNDAATDSRIGKVKNANAKFPVPSYPPAAK
jgi:hypothetical protein